MLHFSFSEWSKNLIVERFTNYRSIWFTKSRETKTQLDSNLHIRFRELHKTNAKNCFSEFLNELKT